MISLATEETNTTDYSGSPLGLSTGDCDGGGNGNSGSTGGGD
jgi:hypothetical protein